MNPSGISRFESFNLRHVRRSELSVQHVFVGCVGRQRLERKRALASMRQCVEGERVQCESLLSSFPPSLLLPIRGEGT